MRIGYGYDRKRAALEACEVDRFYLDGPLTNRSERVHLFRDLRDGDTLVLLAIGDLGAGKGLRNMRAELAARGVEIEIAAEPEPEGPPPKRGRPTAWEPTAAEDERLRGLYETPGMDGGYIISIACEMMGENKEDRRARERVRQRLLRRYGKKSES